MIQRNKKLRVLITFGSQIRSASFCTMGPLFLTVIPDYQQCMCIHSPIEHRDEYPGYCTRSNLRVSQRFYSYYEPRHVWLSSLQSRLYPPSPQLLYKVGTRVALIHVDDWLLITFPHRKIDMLNSDLALSNDASAKKSRKKAGSLKNIEEEQDQAGFHFIAFVPIQRCVWKLDGLERQPMNLGKYF